MLCAILILCPLVAVSAPGTCERPKPTCFFKTMVDEEAKLATMTSQQVIDYKLQGQSGKRKYDKLAQLKKKYTETAPFKSAFLARVQWTSKTTVCKGHSTR